MKCVLRLLALALSVGTTGLLSAVRPGGSAVGYVNLELGKLRFHAVIADLRSEAFNPITVHTPTCVSPRALLKNQRAVAAVTGTFFAPSTQLSVADVLVDGKLVAEGNRGTILAVDWFGKVKIFDVGHARSVDWSQYRYGLRGAVRVVSGGKVMPNPKAQHFKDKRIWGRAARTGVGLTRSGKVCLFATGHPVTLSELGKAMKKVGVINGVSLDGGSSSCLYYQGNFIVQPQRRLNNLFVLQLSR